MLLICSLLSHVGVNLEHSVCIEAIIGEKGKNHKRLLRETGCHRIELYGHHLQPPSMKIIFTVESSKMLAAQELLEDVVVSTVPNEQRPRMLYYLAKDNDYGASDGLARYQRSPSVYGNYEWMAVIETPPEFKYCSGLFLDKNGRAMKEVAAKTGCHNIHLTDCFPKFIYASSDDMEKVNAASKLIIERVDWALKSHGKPKPNRWG